MPKPVLTPQTWNPDHVMVHQMTDGTIPDKHNRLILEEVMTNSKVMQLAKYEEMTDLEKTFDYYAGGIGAYWVGEGEKIRTTAPTYLPITMRAYKLGTIVLCSREYLNYSFSNFFNEMSPKIAEAFYKKFDNATLLNQDNPFPQSLAESVEESGNLIIGDLDYENIIDLQGKVEDEGFNVNAFVSSPKNKSALRQVHAVRGNTTDFLYDPSTGNIDGRPTVFKEEMERGELIAGDFNNMFYGIPFNINFSHSTEAQLSTILNADGTPVNLFEQELFAMRVTMDVGFMIVKDEAFSMLAPEAPEAPEEQETRSGKELNKSEIKAILDEQGIEYTDKETKDELLAKLGE